MQSNYILDRWVDSDYFCVIIPRVPLGSGILRRSFWSVIMSVITIQESFFSAALQGGRHVTVYLLSGIKVSGIVRCFDKYSVVLETEEQEHLVFKHSISAAFLCRKKECASCSPDQMGTAPTLRVSGD